MAKYLMDLINTTHRTSKFMEMGGLVHFFFVSVSKSSISAESWVSFIPAILLILTNNVKR